MFELTKGLGSVVAGLRFDDLDQDALGNIVLGFVDSVGVMIAGRDEPPTTYLLSVLAPEGGPADILFGRASGRAHIAAYINATAAHALDFDDVALRGHPSAVLVPSILAVAQETAASGRSMALAYAAGYEVWAELLHRESGHHHLKGWHPTGIFGSIAAAAACASLLSLDAEKTVHALAIAASQSAGLMANFGSMSKPLHAGHAAQAGVLAAQLAAKGFTGRSDALENPLGFLAAVSPGGQYSVSAGFEVGRRLAISTQGLSVKQYPLCYCTHRAIDSMLALLRERPCAAQDIAAIDVSISPRDAAVLLNHQPQNALAAKFSMEFAMASCVLASAVGLTELTDAFVMRSDVQDLMRKVRIVPDPRGDKEPSGFAPYDQAVVTLTSGEKIVGPEVAIARGAPGAPLTGDELWRKFDDCLRVGHFGDGAKSLFNALNSLCSLQRADEVFSAQIVRPAH